MKRSSPTYPDPAGGPPNRGCFYTARFAFLGLALLWLGLWIAFPNKPVGSKLVMMLGFGIPFLIVAGVPLMGLAERLEIRRYCRSRGFRILSFKWRGVIYMDGDVKRYSRWPEDFRSPP